MSSAFDEITQLAPDTHQLVRVTARLLAALAIGTAIGLQRELTHKPAGLRLTARGTGHVPCLFVAPRIGHAFGFRVEDRAGLATGIGFLGGAPFSNHQ